MVATTIFTHGHGTGPFGTMGPGSGVGTGIIGGSAAAGFGNLSFEEPAGTFATLHATVAGPYALGVGYNLVVEVYGVEYSIPFYPGTQGIVSSAVAEPFNMSGGNDTLDISFDGMPDVSVQWVQGTPFEIELDSATPTTYALFHGATLIVKVNNANPKIIVFFDEDFVDITAATQSEVASVLGLALTGVSVTPTGISAVTVQTDFLGDTANIQLLGGTGASAFTTTSTTPGVGNVQDIAVVTASEVIAAINAATTQSMSQVGPGQSVDIISSTYGTTSTVAISGGTASSLFSFLPPVAGIDLIADMNDVTALEITAAFTTANIGLSATMDGAYLVLTTSPYLTGDIATIMVVGGAANNVFKFPVSTEVRGISNPGYARLWTVETVSQGWELAEFAIGAPSLFPSAYEMFAKGWPASTSPDAFTDVTDISGSESTICFFGLSSSGPFLWEDMTWYPYYPEITATIAVVFSTATYPLTPGITETFSNGYPDAITVNPSNYFDIWDWDDRLDLTFYSLPFLAITAEFGSDEEEFEDFNSEWGFRTSIPGMGNERDIYSFDDLGPERELIDCQFGQGYTETFSDANVEHTDVLINDCTVGNIYAVIIDGNRFTYIAQPGDTEFVIAQELVSNINNGDTTQAYAYQFAFHVVIVQHVPGKDMVVEIDGDNPSELSIVFNHFVMPDSKWPGAYWNPSL